MNLVPFNELERMAQAIARSGLFGMKTPEQALALMLVAQAEGQHPAIITQEYDIIQGRAARKTHSVLARFQQAGGRVEWHQLTDSIADATFSHPSGGSLRIQWTIDQAQRAGLTAKDNWKHYPRAMLRARCIAEGIRAVYPAALGGMLVVEEAQDLSEPKPIGQADTPKPPALPPYPEDRFAQNIPQWWAMVEAGRKSPAEIVAMIESKYSLSGEQKETILSLGEKETEKEAVVKE